eukprot:5657640-Prymnesium_polylepis.1
MAGVYATRLAGSAGGRRASTFRRFHTASASQARWPRGLPSSSATARRARPPRARHPRRVR